MSNKKNTTTKPQANTPALAESIELTQVTYKKYTRFYLPDGKCLAISFNRKHVVNTYFHKDYDAQLAKIEGAAPKTDSHVDDFNYHLRIEAIDPIESVKATLLKLIADNPSVFLAKAAVVVDKTPVPQTPAEPAPAKEPDTDPNKLVETNS